MSSMKSTLQEFIASVRNVGLPTTQHFYVIIPGFEKDELAYCNATSLPGVDLMTSETRIYGEVQTMPYAPMYGTQQLTFISDNTMNIRTKLEEWQNLAYDRKTRSVGFYDDYTKDVQIHVTNKAGDDIYCVTVYEAWIKTIGETQFDYSSEQLVYIPVTLVYKWWETVPTTPAGEVDVTPPPSYNSNRFMDLRGNTGSGSTGSGSTGGSTPQLDQDQLTQNLNVVADIDGTVNVPTTGRSGSTVTRRFVEFANDSIRIPAGGYTGAIGSAQPIADGPDATLTNVIRTQSQIEFISPQITDSTTQIQSLQIDSIQNFGNSIEQNFNRQTNNVVAAINVSNIQADTVNHINDAFKIIARGMRQYQTGITTLLSDRQTSDDNLLQYSSQLLDALDKLDAAAASVNLPSMWQVMRTEIQYIRQNIDQSLANIGVFAAPFASIAEQLIDYNLMLMSHFGRQVYSKLYDSIDDVVLDFSATANGTADMTSFLQRTGLLV